MLYSGVDTPHISYATGSDYKMTTSCLEINAPLQICLASIGVLSQVFQNITSQTYSFPPLSPSYCTYSACSE